MLCKVLIRLKESEQVFKYVGKVKWDISLQLVKTANLREAQGLAREL